jgi:NAD(P)-dependent dehydrogenase (short-subunit alcohol dehydrogenase family)
MGLAGLVRTIAREYPDLAARAVDLDPSESPEVLAGRLLGELLNPDGPEVVGHAGGTRYTLDLVRAPLPPAAQRTAGPAALGVNDDSVVLLTGGARGITARVAVGLAKATGCHVVLWGRTPLPVADEDPATADARDGVSLRRALIASGVTVPAEIEAAVRRILAEREIRTTISQLAAVAASVHYATVDVRDPDAVAAAVGHVYARYGRLDGVVHGAGVLDDKLIADKTSEGFASVWTTKVDGARALAAAVSRDLGFLVLFGSVSGVFGNRGQCDYAAANDALDCLANTWAGKFSGRVLSIDWGPWMPTDADGADSSGNGMVSGELLKQYAKDGVEAIHPDDGVDCLLAELAHGAGSQVVYVCAEPSAFDVAFGSGNRPASSR